MNNRPTGWRLRHEGRHDRDEVQSGGSFGEHQMTSSDYGARNRVGRRKARESRRLDSYFADRGAT